MKPSNAAPPVRSSPTAAGATPPTPAASLLPAAAPSAPPANRKYIGTLLTPRPELAGWLTALGMALAFAALIEWLSLVAPLPMGGDTGTWTALSYPFVGYPHPSEIVPFGYPPLLFPLLGFFVQIGGGPLVGARIYLGFVAVLLGLSTYVLGRSLFRFRVTALLAEAVLFITLPFDRLFFFGGYPTLLALVFMNLALAFAVRYVRARNPTHAVFFWLATAATLLTHEFVGLALVVTLVIMGFLLLVKRQFPWSIIASRAGAFGAAIAALGIGAFYLGVRFAHVPQNNYLSSNALAHQRFSIAAVLYPLRIQAFSGVIGFHTIGTYSPVGSFLVASALALLIFGGLLAAALVRPRYLTPSLIVIGSSILSVLVMAVGGWILNIYTDYRRFAYALYLPYILAGLLAYDTVFHWCSPPPSSPSKAIPVSSGTPRRSGSRLRRHFMARNRTPALTSIVAVCGVVVVVVAGGAFTYPGLVLFQHQYTGSLHSWDYVHAMEAISNSGLPGSVLTLSGGATLHWTFAMTDRNVYSPTIVSGFVFKQARIIDDQLAYFPFHFWTATSNGLEFVAIPGNTSTFFYGAPVFGALRFGTPTPILEFPPDAFVVTLANGATLPAFQPGEPVPAISVTNGSPPSLVVRYVTPDYLLTVTSTSVPGGTTFVNSTATAIGGVGLRQLATGVRQVAGVNLQPTDVVTGLNTFSFSTGLIAYQSVVAYGSVAAPSTVSYGSQSTKTPSAVNLRFQSSSPTPATGSPSLNLSVALTVPGADSFGSELPSVLSSGGILQNWNVRFVLLNNIQSETVNATALFFDQEFSATKFYHVPGGLWEVLLLPQPY